MDTDIIVIGAGPAGLSFARALAATDLRIALVERQSTEQLAEPSYDGREIALTQRSIRLLRELGAWQHLPPAEISRLRAAKVVNGLSPLPLMFETGQRREGELGVLVSNHHIRKALFECVSTQGNVTIVDSQSAAAVTATAAGATVALASGETMSGRVLVGADSRFSAVRDQLGIGADMKRTGTAMLVCRVEHEKEHDHIALEWFKSPETIAMLPLNGRLSSVVLTLPIPEAQRLAALEDQLAGEEIARRLEHRYGATRVVSSRHVYPLVMTYAHHFAIPGAALIGDTAVGMHPVTAHGYNLGLASADRLAREIRRALAARSDWSSDAVFKRYESGHRRTSRPIYAATNMIVGLYGDKRAAVMPLRHAGIRMARRMPFFRSAVREMLLRS